MTAKRIRCDIVVLYFALGGGYVSIFVTTLDAKQLGPVHFILCKPHLKKKISLGLPWWSSG